MDYFPFGGGFDVMFAVVPVMVVVGFILVIAIIIMQAVKSARQWSRNNQSPVLTVEAKVVAKRADVSRHRHDTGQGDLHHASSFTVYYATFEVPSGDRMELAVRDTEYGMLAENDTGRLTFQGTRYLGFERS